MTTHYDEELFAFLSGELGHAQMHDVAVHLRECNECSGELISVAVAVGALRSAHRVENSLRASTIEVESPVSTIFDASSEQPPLRLSTRRPTTLVRWAAAAVLIVGLVTGISFAFGRSPISPVSATAVLHHLDSPLSARGEATVRTSHDTQLMDVETSGLPGAPANHYYEVWLLQPVTNKMLPVGLLSPSGRGSYAVASAVMSQYSSVDISLQDNDGNPAHSKVSVLRGKVVTVLS
jgi:anti-sigma factor RsiW